MAVEVSTTNTKLIQRSSEERYVLGVVIEPDQKYDVDGDPMNLINESVVRRSAHKWLRNSKAFDYEHIADIPDVSIVESYLAPVDFEMEGVLIKRGSWMLGVIVESDFIWNQIKEGKITGFSFEGLGVGRGN